MGQLTTDMTRLREEIDAAHDTRKNTIAALGADVAATLVGFHNARLEMARKNKRERSAFLNGLRKTLRGMRKEVASDLTGMRRAWSGKRP